MRRYRSLREQGYGSGRPMPARQYVPVELGPGGDAWCSGCDTLVLCTPTGTNAPRGKQVAEYCRCGELTPGEKARIRLVRDSGLPPSIT